MVTGDPPNPTPTDPTQASPEPDAEAEGEPKKDSPPYVVEAERISNLLEEKNKRARRQIRKLGRILGVEGIQKLYERTLEIEANGGMMLEDKGRRRSPGGVFFVLSRDLLDEEQFMAVFQRAKVPTEGRKAAPSSGRKDAPRLPSAPKAPPSPPAEIIPFDQLSPEERAAMTIPGKLELTLKIDQLPAKVQTDKNGWKAFIILCGAKEIEVKMRPKMFNKLTDAAANWPSWVASIVGQMGPATAKGFELLEPNVQVFERKTKPVESKPTEPKPAGST